MNSYPVYIATCNEYNPAAVADTLENALEELQLRKAIAGNIVIKPNLVMAHPKVAPESYTRVEVVEGIVQTILRRGDDVSKIDVVEKSGLGVTTASMFRHAGYRPLAQKYRLKLRAIEERPRAKVVLEQGRVHKHIHVAQEILERDFLIFAPRLKTNVLSQGYSGALKLNIGTIDGKERIYRHHYDLPDKIVDILEIANPNLIVTDGIRFAYGGNQMTQPGMALGVLVISTNAVAHDMVCARLLNLDPFEIEHIRAAIRRGYGPRSFKEIKIIGDAPMEKIRKKTRNLDYGFYPVDQFKCNFQIVSGTPYCIGGCQGIFLDWLHMLKDRKPRTLARLPKITALIGKVGWKIEAKTVLLVGDCARATPHIRAKRIVRIRGCPPTHKRIVWDMMVKFLLLAPLVRPSLIWDGFILYPLKKMKGWLLNLKYKPLSKPF